MNNEPDIVLSNKDRIITIFSYKGSKKSSLEANIHQFDSENGTFSSARTTRHSLPGRCSLVKAANCVETTSNLLLPTVLLKSKLSSSNVLYIFVISDTSCELRLIRKLIHQIPLPVEGRKSDVDGNKEHIDLVPGPTISILHNTKLSIFLPLRCHKETQLKSASRHGYDIITKELIPNTSAADISYSPQVFYIGFHDHFYLVVGLLTTTTRDSCRVRTLFAAFLDTCSQAQQLFTWRDAEVDSFIPEEYSDNLNKLLVLECLPDLTCGRELVSFKSCVIAGTLEGYVLRFVNGKLVDCIDLTLSCGGNLTNPDIVVENITILHSEELTDFIIINQQNQSISIIENDFKKVKETLRCPKHILIGDFLKIGSEQLLYVDADVDKNFTHGWLLTDFISHHIDRRKEAGDEDVKVSTSSGQAECSANIAVEALQSKLQADRIFLHEADKSTREKVHFLTSVFSNVANFTLPEVGSSCKNCLPDLRAIVGERKCDVNEPLSDIKEEDSVKKLKVLETWCRIIDEMFVVGVDFENGLNISIKDLSLLLIPLTTSADYLDASFFSKYSVTGAHQSSDCETNSQHPLFDPSLVPRTKRQRCFLSENERLLPDIKRGSIACCICLPSFSQVTKFKFSVHLSWREMIDSQTDGSRGLMFSQNCGLIVLQYEDILEQRYNLATEKLTVVETDDNISLEEALSANRDITALNTIHFCTDLTIESVTCLLHKIPEILTKRRHFVYIPRYHCFMSRLNLMKYCRIYIKKIQTQRKIHVTVCTKNRDQFSTLLHHLYYILPDDVIIRHDSQSRTNKICENIVSCLTEEVNSVMSTNRKLLNDNSVAFANSQSSQGLKYSGDGDNLASQADRMEVEGDVLVLNDVVYTGDHIQTLSDHEERSDNAVMKLAKL